MTLRGFIRSDLEWGRLPVAINIVQFQKGMSFFEFHQQFGNEAQCEDALERERWPTGFQCSPYGHRLRVSRRRAFQCRACDRQTSIIAGTLLENTKLPLTVWFLPIYLMSQAKTGLSALSLKLSPLTGFTWRAILGWAKCSLAPISFVLSDGLDCFNGVTDANCHHQVVVAGGRKPRDLPDFKWVNTIIGKVKTNLNGAYHAFRFGKYAESCLGDIVNRFNQRLNVHELPRRLLVAAISMRVCSSATIRSPETT